MNYCSSIADRAIEAINRLLIVAMTSAWTSTLSHQHALPPAEEDDSDDDACSRQHSASPSDWNGRQH
ncbi:hypothetical protein [Bradyrhizobium sp. UFLA05-112]